MSGASLTALQLDALHKLGGQWVSTAQAWGPRVSPSTLRGLVSRGLIESRVTTPEGANARKEWRRTAAGQSIAVE